MKQLLQVTVLMALALPAVAQSSDLEPPEDVVVIVHRDTEATSISRSELSKIFLRRLRTWSDGTSVTPIDQFPDRPPRELFTRWVHQQSVVTVEVYWKRMIFSGKRLPPDELADDRGVVDFVRATPGAVGYVSADTPLEGVRKLNVEE